MTENQIQKLLQQAINAALQNNWNKAKLLNQKIISLQSTNIDAHLALAYSNLQLSNLKEAKKYYTKALKLDPGNTIAFNNLDKIKTIEKKGRSVVDKNHKRDLILDPNMFINIMGKTKLATLTNIGQSDKIALLKVGEKVFLQIKKRRVEVRNKNKDYIGALPDDISKRLIFFLESKCIYSVIVKSASKNQVEVFIKEEKKSKPVSKFISFPKNIQENLKSIMDATHDNQEDSNRSDLDDDEKEDVEEEENDDEEEQDASPLSEESIEQLADQIDEHNYSIEDLKKDEDDEDEFEE